MAEAESLHLTSSSESVIALTPLSGDSEIALTPQPHLEELETFLGRDRTVAIVGGGNMGRVIAKQLVEAGLSVDRLRISVKGSEETFSALEKMGLRGRASTSNLNVLMDCKVVFICVRAQEIDTLKDLPFPADGLIIVITTGISFRALAEITKCKNVIRAQTCGHALIEARKGIVACCPRDDGIASEMFRAMGYLVLKPIQEEMQVHLFSCLVCCPAARVCLRRKGQEMDIRTIQRFIADHSETGQMDCLEEFFEWVMRESEIVLYHESSEKTFEEHIHDMFTKGGLTEALCLTILGQFPSEEQTGLADSDVFYAGLANAFRRCLNLVRANDAKLDLE